MGSSWREHIGDCKSRLSAIARSCFLGRESWREKYYESQKLLRDACDLATEVKAECEQLREENLQLRIEIVELECQLAQPQPVKLPLGEIPPGQQFGAGMIALCVNLASIIGLEPTVRVLRIIFVWLAVNEPIPTYQTIRGWMQRIGLDRMTNARKEKDGVFQADHTVQIGREKVLAIFRVPKFQSPRPLGPLRHCDVEVLAVIPGEACKREDVAKHYREVCKQFGVPRAVGTDGAVELREPVENLGKPGKRPITLRDPKHFLANQMEALFTKDPQYKAFTTALGGTRSALQQTELAHFVPLAVKIKSRFMNLQPTLKWASAVLWHLDHPESESRTGITESRMEQKLGWLREFAGDIPDWQECQQIVSIALTFLNEEGIFVGAAKRFKKLVVGVTHATMSKELVSRTVKFLRKHEQKLKPNERLPISTEILESSFALYKQLEKQHSKGGFTSLLLAFPTLLRETTPEEVTASFSRVKVKDVKSWVKENLATTLTAKRQLMYREARKKKATKTEKSATPMSAAV